MSDKSVVSKLLISILLRTQPLSEKILSLLYDRDSSAMSCGDVCFKIIAKDRQPSLDVSAIGSFSIHNLDKSSHKIS